MCPSNRRNGMIGHGCFCSGESADSLRPFCFAGGIGRGCFLLAWVATVGGVVPWPACSSEEQVDKKVQTVGNHGAETLTGEGAVRYARMLCDGYETNREKFQHYTCRGEIRIGDLKIKLAKKLAHADIVELLGKDQGILEIADEGVVARSSEKCFEGTGFSLEMFHARSGRVERYRSAPMAEKPGQPRLPDRSTSIGMCQGGDDLLTDGQYFLVTHLSLPPHMGEVSKWSNYRQMMYSSWNQTWWGPTSPMDTLRLYLNILDDLSAQSTGTKSLSVTRNIPKIGFTTTRIVFTSPEVEQTWWVCEEKGYIPVFSTYYNKQSNFRAWYICDDIRRLGRRGWWPMHIMNFGEGSAVELRVLDVEVSRPSKEIFTLTLSNTSVYVLSNSPEPPRGPVKLEGQVHVSVDDIPRLLARYYGQAEPPKPRPLWRYVAIVVVVTSLTVVGVWYAFVRYRRRR